MWRALLLLIFVSFAAPAARAQEPEEALQSLTWLVGCWRTIDARGETTEAWIFPQMPALVGYSVTVSSGRNVSWMQARIARTEDGLILVMMPDGRGPFLYDWTDMRRPRNSESFGEIGFQNQRPGFPQRIAYARDGDRLTVTMSGGRSREDVFVYQRVDCAGVLPP